MELDATGRYAFADVALARRLERAEGRGGVDFVEARARAFPESRAAWIDVAGTYATFDGVESPITQTFGLGMFQPLGPAELDQLEDFFKSHGAPIFHEVSPLADASALTLLNDRLYRPFEFTSVMSRPIASGIAVAARVNPRIRVRVVTDDEHNLWARTAAAGWSETPGLGDFMLSLAQVSARRRNAVSFLADLDGRPIATGALSIHEGVALLAGASTIPEGRKQGAQNALLESRLRYATDHGCDLAMMCALPGSASQRNAERQGFRIAYTRIKWTRT